MKKFAVRAASGLVYAALMIFSLYWDNIMLFLALMVFFQFVCTRELIRIGQNIFPEEKFPIGHFILAMANQIFLLIYVLTEDPIILYPMILTPVILMTHIILSKQKVVVSALTLVISVLYIGLPIMFITELKFIDVIIPLAVLFMIWINDTMAYITGSLIGKTPLSPISPKKTIEGTSGGVIFTMIFAGVFGYFYKETDFTIWVWIGLGLIVGIFGNLGDLFESYLKRKAGIKDSGNIMPGHGGLLDRLDSILFVFPIVYVFLNIIALIYKL